MSRMFFIWLHTSAPYTDDKLCQHAVFFIIRLVHMTTPHNYVSVAVNMINSHIDIILRHVIMVILHVNINKSHVIIIMLHVEIIYLA